MVYILGSKYTDIIDNVTGHSLGKTCWRSEIVALWRCGVCSELTGMF